MVAVDVREALLKATLKLFAEMGSRGATTRRIALEAGVNEVTLFRHFPTKEGLLQAALLHFVEQTQYLRLPATPEDPGHRTVGVGARPPFAPLQPPVVNPYIDG